MEDVALYKDRFENLLRVAEKITATLSIGDILETIRDQVKIVIPHVREACLILVDPEAASYTRPLHCTMKKDQVNCHLCKKGKSLVNRALAEPVAFHCSMGNQTPEPVVDEHNILSVCEIALPVYNGHEQLAVLNVVTEDGYFLNERDMCLLRDLTNLATNTIINAKKYSKMELQNLTLERIIGHIKPFVPETVHNIVAKNPEAPAFEKTELDVSILFIDVADYTRISETQTRDKVQFVIEKFFSAFLDIIYTFGGDVNETAGDGLMAIFQGDKSEHALNAATAALKIRRKTMDTNQELDGLFPPVIVNMGINSGIALVGMTRFVGESHTRMTFTASGSVTNLAARLSEACKEGEILVGPETAHRINDRITLWSRGVMTFKNFREPIQVFSLAQSI